MDTFESDTKLFIVMELIRGGDLFDRIVDKGKYDETSARNVMKKIMSAVLYLHERKIIHRFVFVVLQAIIRIISGKSATPL